jgi:RNA recognition motif-containing protein
MNLYVGNINFDATEDDIRKLFEEIGIVEEVKMMYDKENGKFKGFAFVEMPDIEEAVIAWKVLNGRFFFDRNIVVNQGSKEEEKKDKKPFNKSDQNRSIQRKSFNERKQYNNDRPRSFESDRPRSYESNRTRPYESDKQRSYGADISKTFDNRKKEDSNPNESKRPRVLRPRIKKSDE